MGRALEGSPWPSPPASPGPPGAGREPQPVHPAPHRPLYWRSSRGPGRGGEGLGVHSEKQQREEEARWKGGDPWPEG